MTTYQRATSAGIGDPYWYEWSIGLEYIVDLLDPDSDVESVTLQDSGNQGLDDVVGRFTSVASRFLQVKTTRTEATFHFGDIVV